MLRGSWPVQRRVADGPCRANVQRGRRGAVESRGLAAGEEELIPEAKNGAG